jgi:hypothetical protein
MSHFKKIFLIFQFLFFLLPSFSLALNLNLNYPTIFGLDLNRDQDINKVVAWFYYFIISIGGLAAFVMLVWGGFQWLTSAGSPTKISEAKDRINSAILGLVIILASYLILQVINPELLILKLPQLP